MQKIYNIISTGSSGNCVIYDNLVMVDIGVTFKAIKPHVGDIGIVLLTHSHLDHININTLKKLQSERPTLRIGCGGFMVKHLEGLENIDVYELGNWYDYDIFKVAPVRLFHDVPNFGYRLDFGGYKIFHATDTAHLNGIEAKGYDLYAVEHNYDEDTIKENIRKKEEDGKFPYEKGALETHLSIQQSEAFIFNNKKEGSEVLRLHMSENNI